MKKTTLLTTPLLLTVAMLLTSAAIAQPAANRRPIDAKDQALADMVQKHTRVVTSTKENPAPLSSQQYDLVLGQIILNPAERALIPESDLRALEGIPGRRDRRFVQTERVALSSVCGKLNNRGSLDVSDVAQEFDNSRNGSEQQLLRHYEEAVKKLSPNTQQYIQSRLIETASQVTFVQSTVNLFEMSLEAPEMAERLLTGGCKRYEDGLAREPLRDITLLDEVTDARQFAPIIVESE